SNKSGAETNATQYSNSARRVRVSENSSTLKSATAPSARVGCDEPNAKNTPRVHRPASITKKDLEDLRIPKTLYNNCIMWRDLVRSMVDVVVPARETEKIVRELTLEDLLNLQTEDGLPYHDPAVRALVWEIKYYANRRAA